MAAWSQLRAFMRLARGITRTHCATFRRSASSMQSTAFLITLPPIAYLGYEILRRVSCATAVVALSKAEEAVEQADYLYSCGETEKLYQLLLQYKDRPLGTAGRVLLADNVLQYPEGLAVMKNCLRGEKGVFQCLLELAQVTYVAQYTDYGSRISGIVYSDDAEFLWRLARASRDLSLLPHITADLKKKLTYEAFDYAKKALEKNEVCFAAHKWYAVCLSDVGEYEGVKVKIGNSLIIREHLEKAVELNPKDATSFHILGFWCFAFAELPGYQRKVAAILFASPPTATYEEALAFFLKAEEVDPNFYSKNLLILGKTYMMLKDQEKALLWLYKARDYPVITEEDKEVHKEAVDLLKKLNG